MNMLLPLFLCILAFSNAQIQEDNDWEEYEMRLQKVQDKIESDEKLSALYDELYDMDDDDEDLWPPVPDFDCDIDYESEPATSVHTLRAKDINVIASFGDSITAGNALGATTLPGSFVENRGESWCIGGNQTIETVCTVPNLIKEYNPGLKGASWSPYAPVGDFNRTHCEKNWDCAQLNLAEPGGTNRAMERQAREMVERMNDPDYNVDVENDWKMITLFIGGNDLCRVCENWNSYSPEAYRDGIQRALDHLHENLPKTFVNLVIMFDVSPLRNMSTGPLCDAMHWGFCVCAFNETTREMLRPVQLEYYEQLVDMVESGRYDTRDDFTVVIQPHQRDIEPIYTPDGDIDFSYFSPDCFHPSRKGHHGFAYMLWNVMHMPVGHKPFAYDSYEEPVFRCPSEDYPYLFTNQNSDVDWEPKKALKLGRRR
jgi:phospholipase B1